MKRKMNCKAALPCRPGLLCIFYTYFLVFPLFASASGAITNPDAKSAFVAGTCPATRSALAGRTFYAPQGVRGPLKVSPNGRYFVYADGTPFFYLGDTAWELFHRLDRQEADTYLQDRANKGFNVIQAVVLAEQDGLRVPNPYGQVPFQNLDPTKPNEAYFQHVDYIVNKAASLGMYTGMLPTWGDKWNNWWGIGPMIFNQSNARTYGAWLANRYKSKPIIWILGGDRVPTKPEHYGVIRAMAEGIRSVVGDSQLITFHPDGKKTSASFFHGDRWMSFNTYQSGHYAYNFDDAYQLAAENYRRSPAKPSFNIEPMYEDHPVNWQPATGWFNDYDVRQAAYWSVFSGGAGHTYGNHNIWQFYDPNGGYKRIGNARTPWKQALGHAGAGQMRHLRKLMEARKMLTLVPDQGVIASGQGGGADYMAAARGEDFAFVYVSTGQNVTVNLGKVSGNEVRGWWYDPRTGRATHIGKFDSEGARAFDAPGSKGRGNDWVLILDDASKNYAAPDGTRPPQDEPANQQPVVSISQPANNATFTADADVTLQVNASDKDGSVSKVEFYNGNTKLGEATSAPWSFAWKDVKEGKYAITAKATDNDGATATTGTVNISVKAPAPAPNKRPVVSLTSPDDDVTFTADATVTLEADANDEDGRVTRVEYYNGDAKLGEATSAPWRFTWENVKEGKYRVTARATDNDKATATSSAVTITVKNPAPVPVPNKAPVVALTAPSNNAGFTAGADIAIAGNASDEDGRVSKVEFFAGDDKLGEKTSAPWNFTWKDVKEGSYTITAKATDNDGATVTSAGVAITVKAITPDPEPEPEPQPVPPVASCSATGTILEEVWTNVPGIAVNNIPVNKNPDAANQLTLFEAPSQAGDNYGRRIRGYVCPPTTGDYTFFIASDDHGELWLSTDDSPANKVRIAEVKGWARKGEWDKYPSQRSESVALQAGKKYYIEALQKDEAGADNLAVGWQLPGGALERPIPGERLSSFVQTPDVASCEDTGGLLREFWADAPGCNIGSIPLHRPATSRSIITSFEGPINVAHDYGARIRGYICPPATGDYTFWLASDDAGELWISTDDDPANKTRIAFVNGWTNPREWEKYPTQKSATLRLETGRRYYVEVLHKDCENGDYVGVGWQMPNGELARPIAGNHLIPFRSANAEELDNLQRAEVYPNPAGQTATLKFYSREDHDAEIVVTNSLALHVLTLKKAAKAGSNEVKLELGDLPRGVYYISIDNQYAEKLIIAR